MATYIISYDLNNATDAQYESLYKKIKGYGTWAHITESTWAIVTEQKAVAVRDYLTQNLPQGSRLFVIKSGVEAAWKNVMCKNEWLKNNL
ncbi:hypothetical protein MACH07_21260 [Flagellimonas marinaquae]|uniref:CRISPR-associated protein Cas2 n=1 Tax=Flagellimonas marinaquae TaxID=254955 RepID=A0AA48HAG6_9FLAO|nr:hypothetical protein MACH07_21260 [Allomuricauda aquimarina]